MPLNVARRSRPTLYIKIVRMTRTLILCACSSIRWRFRALTEFPYDLRRISHSLCNNKQSLKLPSFRWNFQKTKQTGRFGWTPRVLFTFYENPTLRPPSPLDKFPVARSRTRTTSISEKRLTTTYFYRLYAYMVSLISPLLPLSLFSPYSFLLILASRARTHTHIHSQPPSIRSGFAR